MPRQQKPGLPQLERTNSLENNLLRAQNVSLFLSFLIQIRRLRPALPPLEFGGALERCNVSMERRSGWLVILMATYSLLYLFCDHRLDILQFKRLFLSFAFSLANIAKGNWPCYLNEACKTCYQAKRDVLQSESLFRHDPQSFKIFGTRRIVVVDSRELSIVLN